MVSKRAPHLYVAKTVEEAVTALHDYGHDGEPIAGATWIMRAPVRREPLKKAYVSLMAIGEMNAIDVTEREISIGASVTHQALAAMLGSVPSLKVLTDAAEKSANPAVRGVATIGGNLCSAGFPSADLVPALISLAAEVELATVNGSSRTSVEAFLQAKASLEPGAIVRRVSIPRRAHCSAHARLPLRKAGDYPVAIVSAALEAAPDGRVSHATVAVGSVEARPRRWPELENALVGGPLDADRAKLIGAQHLRVFKGRDGVEAPGWYRTQVLPALLHRAIADIQAQFEKQQGR
ncbi:FAD binding domain-containing protein [Paraburkholderia rhynchosiae]|uniref:Carbon monoxide dehydrogenase medium chain n=1 Tax=Paraburkholderia rhynchosiae TaxID=487049 RepID=A0A2N7WDN0_9BURK|nr:FAD binding domain-containing protein [Paraburkholderia rhynchosiae]PMS27483.1 FAD-binding molybdopterin dehydrogenase [Paraburkholderia rhynchosiae]CAB3723844.1 Carbon monoxide dehydrogenase medium chain [Paraburkholderia rhynchosiae]